MYLVGWTVSIGGVFLWLVFVGILCPFLWHFAGGWLICYIVG
jgi:hypothetical protein